MDTRLEYQGQDIYVSQEFIQKLRELNTETLIGFLKKQFKSIRKEKSLSNNNKEISLDELFSKSDDEITILSEIHNKIR